VLTQSWRTNPLFSVCRALWRPTALAKKKCRRTAEESRTILVWAKGQIGDNGTTFVTLPNDLRGVNCSSNNPDDYQTQNEVNVISDPCDQKHLYEKPAIMEYKFGFKIAQTLCHKKMTCLIAQTIYVYERISWRDSLTCWFLLKVTRKIIRGH
jgi:hypothetical protein